MLIKRTRLGTVSFHSPQVSSDMPPQKPVAAPSPDPAPAPDVIPDEIESKGDVPVEDEDGIDLRTREERDEER